MVQSPIWPLLVSFLLLVYSTRSDDVKNAMLIFFEELNNNNGFPDPSWGWNTSSEPCTGNWKGVSCSNNTLEVKEVILDGFSFPGTFNPSTLCGVQSLAESLGVISLNDNNVTAENLDEISRCKYLARLHLRGNRFSGIVPHSWSQLNNLKVLEISSSKFSGDLPNLARISGLIEFLAQDNQLSGRIPDFDFSNFQHFNVSSNNFSGPIPEGGSRFDASSYADNPNLCGDPLPNKCMDNKKRKISTNQILMFSGYFAIGLAIVLLVVFKFCRKGKNEGEKENDAGIAAFDGNNLKQVNSDTSEYKSAASKSGVSVASAESAMVSSSLVVLTSPEVNGLKFEELLKAPAELLGRGTHGSAYKVICDDQRLTLAVKRIKDWSISSDLFKQRMKRLGLVRHQNVLPPIAFYCSKQEKLIVYEYQPNGSLFKLLHGEQMNQVFDWASKLSLAASVASALAYMHDELREEGIAHGNLKSSNILLNQKMEPCISEYGLMLENQDLSIVSNVSSIIATQQQQQQQQQQTNDQHAAFKSDIYAFGVILLEILTGKVAAVQSNGMDLAQWVVSVVREEWTVEVFDKNLIREGASEERMVNLLRIAIKCVNGSPGARPSINQVAFMINTLKEEDERSMDVSEVLNV